MVNTPSFSKLPRAPPAKFSNLNATKEKESFLFMLWPCLDSLAGLELELVSNSSSSLKLTLALEVFDERVRMRLNVLFQSLGVGGGREKSQFLVDPT
jgi:hypothetical protein